MKTRLVLLLTIVLLTNKIFGQSKNEKDLIGIWQITTTEIVDFYQFNYETKEVTLLGFMVMLDEEEAAKMISKIKETTKKSYFGFNDNNTFAAFLNGEIISGAYKMNYSSYSNSDVLELEMFKKNSELPISIEQNNTKQLIIDTTLKELTGQDSEYKIILKYKLLSDKEIETLKNETDFKLFATEKNNSKNYFALKRKEEEDKKIQKEKEDLKKRERLLNEESNTNKLILNDIDFFEAADIIRDKFETNKIVDIIKNESIKTNYFNDNNLYKSTISIKGSELVFVSDTNGAKTIHVVIDKNYRLEPLQFKFYDFKKYLITWLKKQAIYIGPKNSLNYGGDEDIFFESNNLKIQMNISEIDNEDSYAFIVSFSKIN